MGRQNENCGVSDKICKKADDALECDQCVKWYHAECRNMPNQHYKALSKCLNLKIIMLHDSVINVAMLKV